MSRALPDEESVFKAALELPSPEARRAFLEQACGGDQALHARVQALLRVAQEETGFLAEPAIEAAAATLVAEQPGTAIGPYKLLEQLGEGGFGVVFLAEQAQPIRRKVAMKILKVGMDTRQVVARFEAERQALAIMDHPNIARVFDGGSTASGRPFFVMEFVKGVPITEFCDQNRLSPRERLELFTAVCHAVQHAHQKGIIHRDLKPSNILVSRHDTTPVVKVIDFGVAKALGPELTDKTLFTGVAQMIGTPLYMSPEQAGMSDLDIDTRSDIYSLGVLLYELLAGTTPFAKERFQEAAYDEIRRIIREEEPPTPSSRLSQAAETLPSIAASRGLEPRTLSGVVRGDLDWIVMKALEKDRNRRYETANSFAMDLHRYLADEPVLAGPPSAGYRLRKFVRRNRRAIIMIGCVLIALVAGTIFSTWQAVRATKAEQKARANFVRATDAVKRMLTRVADESLVGVPQMEPVRKQLLEDAIEFYEELLAERTSDPEIRLATAEAHSSLAWLNWRFGETSNLESTYQRSLSLLEGLAAEFPEDLRYRTALARGLHNACHWQIYRFDKRRWKEASQTLSRAIALQESVVSAKPDSIADAVILYGFLYAFAWGLEKSNQPAEAEAICRRTVSMAEAVLAKDPNNPGHLRRLAVALARVAELIRRKDAVQAETLLLRAQVFAKRFQEAPKMIGPRGYFDDGVAQVQTRIDQALGLLYRDQNRLREARDCFRRAIALARKQAEDAPKIRLFRAALASHYQALASTLTDPADQEEAEQTWREVIKIRENLAAEFKQEHDYRFELVHAYYGFAAWLKVAKRVSEAESFIRRALSVAVALVADVPDEIEYRELAATSAGWLGNFLEGEKNFVQAEQSYRQALKFLPARSNERPTEKRYAAQIERLQRRLAIVLRASGQIDKAVEHSEQLAVAFPKVLDHRLQVSSLYDEIGRAADKAKRSKEAEIAFQKSLTVMEGAAADFPTDAYARAMQGHRARTLGAFLMTQKRPAEAEKVWAKGIRAFESAADLADPHANTHRFWAAATRRQLVDAALNQGRPKEAEEHWRKSLEGFFALLGTPLQTNERHLVVVGCVERYANWLREQNRPVEAITTMQRGIDYFAGLHANTPSERAFRETLADQKRKLGWLLATAGNAKIRDPERAFELAKHATELTPQDGICWTTLGAAHYRAGRWQDAVGALQKAMELRQGGTSAEWFFLAMAHWRLNDKPAARRGYDQAVQWMEKNQPNNSELRRFKDEAAALLEIEKKKN